MGQQVDSSESRHQVGEVAGQRRDEAAQVVSRVADLIANVSEGLARNYEDHRPAVANQRLVDSASGLVDDIKTNTLVAGRPLFPSQSELRTSSPNAYSKSSAVYGKSPDTLKSTREFLDDVTRALHSLQPSTDEEVGRAVAVLGGLESRARSLLRFGDSIQQFAPFDQTV